jgi:hypothetical protein
MVLFSRITFHKRKLVPTLNRVETYKDYFLSLIENNTLGDITICFFGFVLLVGNKLCTLILNSLKPEEINQFPTYLIVYWFHHVTPCLGYMIFWFFIFIWKSQFRIFLIRTIKEFIMGYKLFEKLFA